MPHKLYNPFDYLFSTSIDKRCVMISSLFFVDVGVCLLFLERVANPFSKKVSLTYNATIAIVVTQYVVHLCSQVFFLLYYKVQLLG